MTRSLKDARECQTLVLPVFRPELLKPNAVNIHMYCHSHTERVLKDHEWMDVDAPFDDMTTE